MATAALIGGAALLAGGQVQEGQLFKAEGEAKKGIADYNAEQLERQAASRLQAGELEDVRQARKARIALGSQIARGGKSGVVSDVDALADTAFQFAMDRNLMMRQSLLQSQQLLGQAGMQRAQGMYALALGKSQRNIQCMKTAGSLLQGGATYGKMGGTGTKVSDMSSADRTSINRSYGGDTRNFRY